MNIKPIIFILNVMIYHVLTRVKLTKLQHSVIVPNSQQNSFIIKWLSKMFLSSLKNNYMDYLGTECIRINQF